eukprot:gene16887-18593_t
MQLAILHWIRLSAALIVIWARMTTSQQFQDKDSGKFMGYSAHLVMPESSVGSLSGCFSTVVAALSKLTEGREQEAIIDLKEAIITLSSISLNDRFIYMISKEAINSIATAQAFQRTRDAFANYNSALYFRLFKLKGTVDAGSTLLQMKKALTHIRKAFSEELYKLPKTSDTVTSFENINMWAKNLDISETLLFALDTITIRVSVELLKTAVDKRKVEDIAASCLGICAGIVGLEVFVKSIASEISIASHGGTSAGAVLHLAASLIYMHVNNHVSSNNKTFAGIESVAEIESLREQSKRQLRLINNLVSNQEIGLNDVYIVNQGLLPKWSILYRNDFGSLHFGGSNNDSSVEYPIYRKQDSTDVLLIAGKSRRVLSATDTNNGDELEILGFDFYGVYSRGYPYKGCTVFIDTSNINRSDYRLNGLQINTAIMKRWYRPNDQVILTDMRNLDQGETIKVSMDKGDDIIIINGMFGEFEEAFENVLHVDLGTGLNTMSFEGMSATQGDIKGIFFDSHDNALSYFHGEEAKIHKVGTVKGVKVLIGSPMNDYVILHGEDSGTPNGIDLAVVQHSGRNFYEINIDELTGAITHKRFQIIDNSDQAPTVVIRTSSPIKRGDVVFVGNTLKVYKARDTKPTVLVASIHVISNSVALVKTVDPGDEQLLQDVASNHLGTEYVNGLSIETKGEVDVNGTNRNDICLLHCEYSTTTGDDDDNEASLQVVDLKGGDDIVVLKDSTFVSPCKINDKKHTVFLDPDHDKKAWLLTIKEKSSKSNNKNVEKVVNAFGSTVVNLSTEKRQRIHLLTEYVKVTSQDMGLTKDVDN